jgi:hypothetical protein
VSSILVFLLVLAIFIGAAYFVLRLIPDPWNKWVTAGLVVLGAIFIINWLTGGSLNLPHLAR